MTVGSTPGELATYLETHKAQVDAALERAVANLIDDLSAEVREATSHGVTTGGKRLRPVLCVSAYEACGGRIAPATYDLAASLELIHAYSLMHDDLPCMDDADLRRGRPTTHRDLGEDATMRAGAALIPAAALQALGACRALGCDDGRAVAVTRALLEAAGAGGMVGGQWLDLLGEGQALDADELDELHRRKTGALLEASLLMGGLAAGAPSRVQACLREYGAAIGLAFQIADDILDATQSAETLGKNPSDAALGKSTYVALYGLEEARERAEMEVDRALEALDRAELRAPMLRALARYVIDRKK
ncbi:MAG: polyprenyl synthetase family protein [Gemmatimonadota bacterium]|nr:polyprenyl synthetase family protein [Gemmatimonadota bacterium]MDH3424185.1 polyprenyl synthetase family protein [Gemmatimonadota bacterium]